MARKNLLANITEEKLTTVNSEASSATPISSTPLARHGAFGAVTRSFDDLAARAQAAQDLEARLVAGETVVDLDPTVIDPSFMTDRLANDDAEFESLIAAVRLRGQDSPILVRPHPEQRGRYQVAFGHRRLRAAQRLGRPVRAVVKALSDRDLILAQGQENSARANLSFIERAMFAWRLEQAQFDRETIMSALGVDKTVVSRMISVVSKIPSSVIEAIGAAPTTGRDRWVELASRLENADAKSISKAIDSKAFVAANSDERFELLIDLFNQADAALGQKSKRSSDVSRSPAWNGPNGMKVARIKATKTAFALVIDRSKAPEFGEFIVSRLDGLYAEYEALARRKHE